MPQPKEPITTALVEALHFRTGFHYIMVREMEMQIPIPSLPGKLPLICEVQLSAKKYRKFRFRPKMAIFWRGGTKEGELPLPLSF